MKENETKIVDPFKVMDKDAISFKPTDQDAKKDAMAILDAIKQKEEEQKFNNPVVGETTQVVDNYMTGNRDQLAKDIEEERKKIGKVKK
jgi:hypothetical protein